MQFHSNQSRNDPIISIGTVADKIEASVSSIRKYEAEGFLIPFKTESGHRLFSLEDIDRILIIQNLIKVQGLNIEGIRRLQSLIPCWIILPCTLKNWKTCLAFKETKKPCWMIKGVNCIKQGNICRICRVYRFGSLYSIENIKRIIYSATSQEGIRKEINKILHTH